MDGKYVVATLIGKLMVVLVPGLLAAWGMVVSVPGTVADGVTSDEEVHQLQETAGDWWVAIVPVVASAVAVAVRNAWNNQKKIKAGVSLTARGVTPPMLIFFAALFLAGCSTVGTTFEETVTEDGVTSTTLYKARSAAGPLGQLDTTSHKWDYRWGGEENEITTGQESAGIDNTQQSVIVQALKEILGPLILRIPIPGQTAPSAPEEIEGITVPTPP